MNFVKNPYILLPSAFALILGLVLSHNTPQYGVIVMSSTVASNCESAKSKYPESAIFFLQDHRIIRDSNMRVKGTAAPGSCIVIDHETSNKYFGVKNPSLQQIKDKFNEPWRDPKIPFRSFARSGADPAPRDYFMPVKVVRPGHIDLTGQMALRAAVSSDDAKFLGQTGEHNPQPAARPIRTPYAGRKESFAEGTICDACHGITSSLNSGVAAIRQILLDIGGNPRSDATTDAQLPAPANEIEAPPLWQEYTEFAKDFYNRVGHNANRTNSSELKDQMVKELIQKFGIEKTSTIMLALTAYKEVVTRLDFNTQIADLASIAKIIDNRAQSNYRTRADTLRHIDVDHNRAPVLGALLSRSQFSVWNNGSQALVDILKLNPKETTLAGDNKRLTLSFIAIHKFKNNEIEFSAEFNNPKTRHYHSTSYPAPNWAYELDGESPRPVIQNAFVKVKWDNTFSTVNLNTLDWPRHIFYPGVL